MTSRAGPAVVSLQNTVGWHSIQDQRSESAVFLTFLQGCESYFLPVLCLWNSLRARSASGTERAIDPERGPMAEGADRKLQVLFVLDNNARIFYASTALNALRLLESKGGS